MKAQLSNHFRRWEPSLIRRLGRSVVSMQCTLQTDGEFTLPDSARIEAIIREHRSGAVFPWSTSDG